MREVSATRTLIGYLCHFEQRYGRRPDKLRISERTVRNIAREMQPTREHFVEETRVLQFLDAARRGTAEFCGIRIEVTHA